MSKSQKLTFCVPFSPNLHICHSSLKVGLKLTSEVGLRDSRTGQGCWERTDLSQETHSFCRMAAWLIGGDKTSLLSSSSSSSSSLYPQPTSRPQSPETGPMPRSVKTRLDSPDTSRSLHFTSKSEMSGSWYSTSKLRKREKGMSFGCG